MKYFRSPTAMILRFRHLLLTLLIVATGIAASGLTRLEYDDDYRNIFSSNSDEFDQIEQLYEDFNLDENDLIIVVEGNELFTTENLAALRKIVIAALGIDGVAAVHSIFDARDISVPGGFHPQLIPLEIHTPAQAAAIREKAIAHPMLAGVFISENAGATLVIATLEQRRWTVAEIEPVYQALREELQQIARGTSLNAGVTGIPALRTEIIHANRSDQLLFVGLGACLAFAIAWLIFRALAAVIVAGIAPALGIIWSMGLLGWAGEPVNVINTTLPVLLLLIGFADSAHLLFHIRQQQRIGRSTQAATLSALRTVGPACVIAAITTAIAFASLLLTNADIIQRFGLVCAVGVLLVLVAVLLALPVAILLCPVPVFPPARPAAGRDRDARWISVAAFGIARPKLTSCLACLLLLTGGLCALHIQTDYRFTEHIPRGNPAYDALQISDTRFGGSAPIRVRLTWDADTGNELIVAALSRVHQMLAGHPEAGAPFSLLNMLMAAGEARSLQERFDQVSELPEQTRNRVYLPDSRQALVSAYVRDSGANALAPLFHNLEASLKSVEQDHPGISLQLTGLTVATARASLQTINELTVSLIAAAAGVFLVLGISLRDWSLGIASIIPNLLPIVATAALMVLSGTSLTYTTVVALIIALGIAVDDSTHYLVHFRQLRNRGMKAATAARRSLGEVGSILLATTAILSCGLLTLQASALPNLRSFGLFAVTALVLALLADLLFLPALTLLFSRFSRRESRP